MGHVYASINAAIMQFKTELFIASLLFLYIQTEKNGIDTKAHAEYMTAKMMSGSMFMHHTSRSTGLGL